MPKPIVKITVNSSNAGSSNFASCEISSSDSSWHGLKELERAGLFEKLHEFINLQQKNNKMFGSLDFEGQPYLGGRLKPHSPKPTALDIEINKNITVNDLTKFFDELEFKVIVTDRFLIPKTDNTTMEDYGKMAEEAWFVKIEREEEDYSKIRKQLEQGQKFPDIQTYQRLYPGTSNSPETMQRLKKHGEDNWQVTFKGESAVKHAIMDAINRSEEFDENGERPKCPITLEPFEGHHQVILILSRHGSDGTMQANFVHAEIRDGSKIVDVAEYLKQIKKNPINNDPIVAMEIGTLSELKDKYRMTRPLRPSF